MNEKDDLKLQRVKVDTFKAYLDFQPIIKEHCFRTVSGIPHDELPRYLTSANIFVSTALSDAGLAASTVEAMDCGLPVVITDSGDNRKWVEDGVNGFIIPLKDPKTLAEKIIYLLKNPDVGKEFGMRNRKIIEERNDYYKEMKKMENFIKS